MATAINISFAGELQQFIEHRVADGTGLYESPDEYLRDLVRRDYEREEQSKWQALRHELRAGAVADESAFVPLDAEAVISQARNLRHPAAHVC
jgi:antitoxin ParD1/3/4